MIGLIPRWLHGVLDYMWAIAFYVVPQAMGFEDDEAASIYSKIRGGSMVATSLFTRYELGLVKLIPFNLHLLFDLMGALFGFAAPWVLGFDKNEKARKASLAFSAFELGAVLLSKRDKE